MGIRHALGASTALAILVGCSAGASQVNPTPLGQPAGVQVQSGQQQTASAGRTDNSLLPPTTTRMWRAPITGPSFMEPNASGHPLIFVSDTPDGVVDVYRQAGKQKMVGRITGLNQPQGLATDAQGNLYVANTNSSNVPVYAPPYTNPPALTLNDAGEFPGDVAVSAAGVVAVTNICKAPHCRAATGSVSFYAKGSAQACATVSDQPGLYHVQRLNFAGFDHNGNLYVDGFDSYNDASFGLIQGGCQATTITDISSSPTFSFYIPGTIQVDKAGNIAIIDVIEKAIGTFAPPSGGGYGSPVSVAQLTGSTNALTFALVASGNDLYSTDSTGSGFAKEYAYPAGGAVENTITIGGQPIGVAVTPPEQP